MSAFRSDLRLIIKAVDSATAPIAHITHKLEVMGKVSERMGRPFVKFGSALKGFSEKSGLTAIGSSVADVGTAAATVAKRIVGLGVAAGAGLFGIIHTAVEAGDKIGELADRTGIAASSFVALRLSAEQADVDQEQFNSSLDKFNRNLGDAKAGGGGLLTFLKKVSPALGQQFAASKTTNDALSVMAQAFAQIEDPAKRAALSAAAFGKGSMQMGNWLHQGNEAIKAEAAELLRLAGPQDEFVKRSGSLDNVLKKNQIAFLGVRNAVATELMPVVEDLSKEFTEFLVENRGAISAWAKDSGKAVLAWVHGGGLKELTNSLKTIAVAVRDVVKWLGPTGVGIAGVTAVTWPLTRALGGLSVNMVALAVKTAPMLISALGWVVTSALPMIGAFTAIAAAAGVVYAATHPTETASFLQTMLREIEELKPAFAWLDTQFAGIDERVNKKLGIKAISPEEQAKRQVMDQRVVNENGLSPAGLLKSGTQWWFNQLPSQRATTDAAKVINKPQQSEAKVTVDFANAPKGTRVTVAPSSTAEVDWSLGVSNVH